MSTNNNSENNKLLVYVFLLDFLTISKYKTWGGKGVTVEFVLSSSIQAALVDIHSPNSCVSDKEGLSLSASAPPPAVKCRLW